MNSQTIVDAYGATMPGQQLLFEDPDAILRKTPFKPVNKIFDMQAIAYWWMCVYKPEGRGDDQTPYSTYSKWSNAAGKFKYIYLRGYNPKINQQAVSIKFKKSVPLPKQKYELNMFLPYIIPCEGERGSGGKPAKQLPIFEHTLSYSASYSLSIYSDTDITVNAMRYGGLSVLRHSPNLDDALEYVRINHYYEK
jgi:hypothetical protein